METRRLPYPSGGSTRAAGFYAESAFSLACARAGLSKDRARRGPDGRAHRPDRAGSRWRPTRREPHRLLEAGRPRPRPIRLLVEQALLEQIKAIAPLLEVLDQFDRGQRAAKVKPVSRDEARKNLPTSLIGPPKTFRRKRRGRPRGRPGGPCKAGFIEQGRTGEAKRKRPWGVAQVLEKAQFGQENPSFSLGWIWPNFAGFGQTWLNLGLAWIFLGNCASHAYGCHDIVIHTYGPFQVGAVSMTLSIRDAATDRLVRILAKKMSA